MPQAVAIYYIAERGKINWRIVYTPSWKMQRMKRSLALSSSKWMFGWRKLKVLETDHLLGFSSAFSVLLLWLESVSKSSVFLLTVTDIIFYFILIIYTRISHIYNSFKEKQPQTLISWSSLRTTPFLLLIYFYFYLLKKRKKKPHKWIFQFIQMLQGMKR